jgi:hypothetical protein
MTMVDSVSEKTPPEEYFAEEQHDQIGRAHV